MAAFWSAHASLKCLGRAQRLRAHHVGPSSSTGSATAVGAPPSRTCVLSRSVCQLFRLVSRFVPDFNVSGKTAEPKMAFNFAHLLSAACGGAPHRLRRLRRPWRRAVRAPLCGFRGGLGSRKSRFVPDFDVSGKTAEPKMAFNFAHLLSAACGGAPRRLGRLRRPPGRWQQCARGCGCARYTTGALWRAPGEHDYAVVASTRERVASIFTKTLGVPSAASIRSDVTVPGAPGGTA